MSDWRRRIDTLRTRVLLLVIGVGLVPSALLALWLTAGTARSGERLLRSRLHNVLDQSERHIAQHWAEQRYAILFIAESSDVQRELRQPLRAGWQPAALPALFEELPATVLAVRVLDTDDAERWSARRAANEAERTIDIDQPIIGTTDGAALGVLRATLQLSALLPRPDNTTAGLDAVLAVVDRASGRSLLPLPFGAASLEARRFTWGEDEWVTERRLLQEPPLTLVAAAPVTLLTPFRRAAVRAAVALAFIAAAGLIAAALLSKRVTRSLEELAEAATAVAQGDLERNVEVAGTTEVRNVAQAFNTMTTNLRRSLDVAAQREALAAVGSFAAELAHEIRNPLGAMRLDLELIEEQLPADSPLRAQQRGAIRELERLSQVVSGALDLARSGRITRTPVNLAEPLRAAVHYAAPRFEQRGGGVTLTVPDNDIIVSGEDHSLQRLFLNVLLNAADAVSDGGHCDVLLDTSDGQARVRISDNGRGMDPHTIARAQEAFFTTRPSGTGLGLAVATRIAQAHGGELHIATNGDSGTTVELRLPVT